MGLIPKMTSDEHNKCDIRVEAKYTKKPFKTVVARSSELLVLIHIDLADFRNNESR